MNNVIKSCMNTHVEFLASLREFEWVMTDYKGIPCSHITEKLGIHTRNLKFIYDLIDKSYIDLCNGNDSTKELMFLTSQIIIAYNCLRDTLKFVKPQYYCLNDYDEMVIIKKIVDYRNSLVHPILNFRKRAGKYLITNEIMTERSDEITLLDIIDISDEWKVVTETIELGDIFSFIISLDQILKNITINITSCN